MTALLKTVNSVGNFLAREQWRDRNWCRADVAIDYSTANVLPFEVGEVLGRDATLPDAPFVRLVAGLTAQTEFVILVDERTSDPVFYNHVPTVGYGVVPATGKLTPDWKADTLTLAALVRGDALVRKDGLTWGAAAPADKDTITAYFKSKGIIVQEYLHGKYSTDQMKAFRDPSNDVI